jgi:ABC-type multidrug transport system ATPase subunit
MNQNNNKYNNQSQSYELKWQNITIAPKNLSGNCCKRGKNSPKIKNILTDLSGSVKTGEALAIIGGSGAGKTTLLNFLSKKIDTSNLKISGKITLSGIEVLNEENKKGEKNVFTPSEFEAISAYVMQDDLLEAVMTPLEILLFTAKLKLHESEEVIEKRVSKMLNDLNLNNCKNTRIGDNNFRGVSGGERKRTSIAAELISDPKIVFLDEPTTGLDSFNAHEVVQKICELARIEGKIIIFTIHQPSSEIYNILDKILVLADGKTNYFGDKNYCLQFFDEQLMLKYPGNYNPFEYFIEMTTFDVFNNDKVKSIKAYNNILTEGLINNENEKGKENTNDDDNKKQENYSKYISLLSDIFNGKKKLVKNEENNFVEFDVGNNNNNKVSEFNNIIDTIDISKKEELDIFIKEKQKTMGFCYETLMLFGRIMILSVRNQQRLFFKCISNVFTAIFSAILFTNVKKNK